MSKIIIYIKIDIIILVESICFIYIIDRENN